MQKEEFLDREEYQENLLDLFQYSALERFYQRGKFTVKDFSKFDPKKYLDDDELKQWNENIKLLKKCEKYNIL